MEQRLLYEKDVVEKFAEVQDLRTLSTATIGKVLKECPTADPVKHGEWFLLDECSNHGVYCSVCHKKVYKDEYANQKVKSPYCPNCEARMDGEFVED